MAIQQALIILITLLLFLLNGCDIPETSSDSENSEIEDALRNEFDLIQVMPNAIENRRSFTKKPELIGIGASYVTDSNYKEITDYYDTQIKSHGWVFDKEEKVTGWGVDCGGKSVHYKKDDYIATVQYAGEKADYGWTFAFSMSWRAKK